MKTSKASQLLACQAGVMKALQRAVWSLIFLGFGMHLVKAEEQASQVKDERKRPLSNSPSRSPMDEEEDVAVGDL